MHGIHTQGETVNLSFNGTISNTSSQAIGIYDANGTARTLLPYERLIVDDINAAAPSATGTNVISVLNVVAGASSATQANTVATLIGADNEFARISAKEGISIPAGIVPSLILTASSAIVFQVTGTAHIVAASPGIGTSSRPAWREALTTPTAYA